VAFSVRLMTAPTILALLLRGPQSRNHKQQPRFARPHDRQTYATAAR
jgi:hypothetical protein